MITTSDGTIYEDGEPCSHVGCRNHITHPCEKCGRKGARGEVCLPLYISDAMGEMVIRSSRVENNKFDFQLKYFNFDWWVKVTDIKRDPDAIVAALVPDHKPRTDSALVERLERLVDSYGPEDGQIRRDLQQITDEHRKEYQ